VLRRWRIAGVATTLRCRPDAGSVMQATRVGSMARRALKPVATLACRAEAAACEMRTVLMRFTS
jgi:hypothetical protein